MEPGKSKICRADGQARDPGTYECCSSSPKPDSLETPGKEPICKVKSEGHMLQNLPLAFCSLHIREGILLYSKSTNLNASLT